MTMYRAFIMEVDMEEEKKEFTVDTPMGTIVAYASTDPLNPGIFMDLRREGYDFSLNLACIECNIDGPWMDSSEDEDISIRAGRRHMLHGSPQSMVCGKVHVHRHNGGKSKRARHGMC